MRAGGGISRQAALPCLCRFVVGGGLIISLPFFFKKKKTLAVPGMAEGKNPEPP